MQIRTKYFIIFLLVVVLFIGLVTKLAFSRDFMTGEEAASVVLSLNQDGEEVLYQADVDTTIRRDRPSRLEELRSKIASRFVPEPEIEEEPTVADEVIDLEAESIILCNNYTKYSQVWNPVGLKFEVVEGARILSREIIATTDSLTVPNNEVVLQLPVRLQLFQAVNNCLQSDVVAIALDGSLIRNEDHKLYGIFGSETVVGYTLDGFALYGLNKNIPVDTCGGALVDGEYRYYLSSEREGVLGCFSSTPVNI